MRRAIVTGATGFLGRHVVEQLCRNGTQVYAVFHNGKNVTLLPRGVHCVLDDMQSASRLEEKLRQVGAFGADVFYHFAWNGVRPELKNDFERQRENISIGLTALDASYALQCGKFVNAGTVAEYVQSTGLIDDHEKPTPMDVYGALKVAVRYLMTARANTRGQNIIHTVLSSCYGEYRTDDNVISYTIKALLRGEKPSYGSLEQYWNFVYVRDAAYAFYLIGEKGIPSSTYMIGTEERRPLYTYICQIRDYIDPSLPLGIGEKKERYASVLSSCVDITKLREDTGFEPEYSFLQGIENTVRWMGGYFSYSIIPFYSRAHTERRYAA